MIKRITCFGLMFLSFAPPKLPTPNSSRDRSSGAAAAADDSYASEEAAAADVSTDLAPDANMVKAACMLYHDRRIAFCYTHSDECMIIDTFPKMLKTSQSLIPRGVAGSAILANRFKRATTPAYDQYGVVFSLKVGDKGFLRYHFEYLAEGVRLLANFLKQKTIEEQRKYLSRFVYRECLNILSGVRSTYSRWSLESLHAGEAFLLSYSPDIIELIDEMRSIDLLSKFAESFFDKQEDKISFILSELNPEIGRNKWMWHTKDIKYYRHFKDKFNNKLLEDWMKSLQPKKGDDKLAS